jgi:hypothetical protein
MDIANVIIINARITFNASRVNFRSFTWVALLTHPSDATGDPEGALWLTLCNAYYHFCYLLAFKRIRSNSSSSGRACTTSLLPKLVLLETRLK